MKKLTFVWLLISTFLHGQQLHPTQIGLFGSGANSFMISDAASGGGIWTSLTATQGLTNYWTKAGSHLEYVGAGWYVGIGKSTPAYKLHVKDPNASYVAQFEGSTSTSIINVGSGSENGQSAIVVKTAGGQTWIGQDAVTGLSSITGTSGSTGFQFNLGGSERMRLHSTYRLAIGGGYTSPIALITNTSTAYDDNYGTVGNGSGFAFNSGTTSINYAGGIRNEADNGSLGGNGFLVQGDIQGRGAYVLSVTRSNAAKTRLFTVTGNGQTHVGNFTGASRAFNVNGESYFSGNTGFGVMLPFAKVHVEGGDIYCLNNGSNPRFLLGDGVGAGNYGGFRWVSASDQLQLYTDNGGAGNGLNLFESNNVAIGSETDNGFDRLQVTGNIQSSGLAGIGERILATNAAGRIVPATTVTAAQQLSGNFGQLYGHVNSDANTDKWGWTYVSGGTNTPNSQVQWYINRVGLGAEYPTHSMQLAISRMNLHNGALKLYVRNQESGAWGAWKDAAPGTWGQKDAFGTYTDGSTMPLGWNLAYATSGMPNTAASQWYTQTIQHSADYPTLGVQFAIHRQANVIDKGFYVRDKENGIYGDWRNLAPWVEETGKVYRVTGNIGIGTNLPAYKLDISSTTTIPINAETNAAGAYIRLKDSNANGWYFGSTGGKFAIINTDNSEKVTLFQNGNFSIGSVSDNGERLQVAGNILINNTIKTTNSLLTLNANGATTSLASNGTLAIPYQTVAPTGVTDGRIWSYQLAASNIKLQYGKTSATIRTVANVEEDVRGDYVIHSTGAYTITGTVRTIDLDANTTAITVTCGNGMEDGQIYSVRCRRNASNTITFNAASGLNFGLSGISTLLPTTFNANAYEVLWFRKHGTQIHVMRSN